MKPEYPCLFGGGIHCLSRDDIEAKLISAHADNAHRAHLWSRFSALLAELEAIGLPLEVWVAGSFTTEDPSPGDVDAVFSADLDLVNALQLPEQQNLGRLLGSENHLITKTRYMTDAFFFLSGNDQMKSYWMGKFGFTRSGKAKGIATFNLMPKLLS